MCVRAPYVPRLISSAFFRLLGDASGGSERGFFGMRIIIITATAALLLGSGMALSLQAVRTSSQPTEAPQEVAEAAAAPTLVAAAEPTPFEFRRSARYRSRTTDARAATSRPPRARRQTRIAQRKRRTRRRLRLPRFRWPSPRFPSEKHPRRRALRSPKRRSPRASGRSRGRIAHRSVRRRSPSHRGAPGARLKLRPSRNRSPLPWPMTGATSTTARSTRWQDPRRLE